MADFHPHIRSVTEAATRGLPRLVKDIECGEPLGYPDDAAAGRGHRPARQHWQKHHPEQRDARHGHFAGRARLAGPGAHRRRQVDARRGRPPYRGTGPSPQKVRDSPNFDRRRPAALNHKRAAQTSTSIIAANCRGPGISTTTAAQVSGFRGQGRFTVSRPRGRSARESLLTERQGPPGRRLREIISSGT
jgi:hypothetical protein